MVQYREITKVWRTGLIGGDPQTGSAGLHPTSAKAFNLLWASADAGTPFSPEGENGVVAPTLRGNRSHSS